MDAVPMDFVTVVTMGATMFLEVQNGGAGPAVRSADAERLAVEAVRSAGGARVDVEVVSLDMRSGADLTLAGVLRARDAALGAVMRQRAARAAANAAIAAAAADASGAAAVAAADLVSAASLAGSLHHRRPAACVFVTGTDCLEEFALALDYLLPPRPTLWRPPGAPAAAASATGADAAAPSDAVLVPPLACVVTGAMRPASALCPDGPANLADAITAARAMAASPERGGRRERPGVVVAMGGRLHAARHVRKACSDGTAGTAFSSGPEAGPVGSVGPGCVTWASEGGPPPPASVPPWGGWRGGGGHGDGLPCDDDLAAERLPLVYSIDPARDLRTRVPVWTLTCDAMAPPEALLDGADGLVLAAPGAGSVGAAVLAGLAPAARARRLPVVLVSRCGGGPGHDAGLYGEASVAKYEQEGFEVGRRGCGGQGHDRLAPVQARLALSVALTLRAALAREEEAQRAAEARGKEARRAAEARGGEAWR